jgi:glycerol transport system ATP-binding protein
LSLYQKQLTGFAKALVRPEVALVLLDEPLTAVEPAIKWRLRIAVKRAQEELQATMIYVTHDQTEALTFADRVSLLHDGRVLQTGTPAELYEKPQHEEVARFIGSPGMNLVAVEVVDGRLLLRAETQNVPIGVAPGIADGPATLGFRPEWAELSSDLSREGDGLAVRVVATRLAGADAGIAQGFVSITLGTQRAQVWRRLDFDPGAMLQFNLSRHELFRDGWRLS